MSLAWRGRRAAAAGLGAVTLLLLGGCGTATPTVAPRLPADRLPTAELLAAGRQAVAQARATTWLAQARRAAAAAHEAAVRAAAARAAQQRAAAAPAVTVSAPARASAPPPPAATGISIHAVPVVDPQIFENQAPVVGLFVGFLTTINPATGTATVGPGWEWETTPAAPNGTWVAVYSGGTLTLPGTLPATEVGPPGVYSLWVLNTAPAVPTTTVTVGVYSDAAPPTMVDPANGLINGWQFGTDGGSLVGPGLSINDPYPTWITWENTLPGLTWSGGAYGVGTPAITSP